MLPSIDRASKSIILALILTSPLSSAWAASHVVTMKSISYDPKKIEIKTGDTIEWVNRSYTEHSATADDKISFDTGMVQPGKSSRKIDFRKPGTYTYHCSVHGKTMSGQVVVGP